MKISQLTSTVILALGLTTPGCSERQPTESQEIRENTFNERNATVGKIDAALAPKPPVKIVKKNNQCPAITDGVVNGVEVTDDTGFSPCEIRLRRNNEEVRFDRATPENINAVLDPETVVAIEAGQIEVVRQKLLKLLEQNVTLGRTRIERQVTTPTLEFSRLSEVYYPTQGWARLRHSQSLVCKASSQQITWTDEWTNARPSPETQTRVVAPNFQLTAEPPNFLLPDYKSEVPRLENFDPIMAVPSDTKPDHQWMDEHFPNDTQLETVCRNIAIKINDLNSKIPIDETATLIDISPKAKSVPGIKTRQQPPRILLDIKRPR